MCYVHWICSEKRIIRHRRHCESQPGAIQPETTLRLTSVNPRHILCAIKAMDYLPVGRNEYQHSQHPRGNFFRRGREKQLFALLTEVWAFRISGLDHHLRSKGNSNALLTYPFFKQASFNIPLQTTIAYFDFLPPHRRDMRLRRHKGLS